MSKYGSCLVFLLATTVSCNRNAGSYLEKGNMFFQQAQYEDASINYRKAIQKDAALGEAHYRLGLSEWKLGRIVPAFQSLYRAAELMPDRLEPKVKLADISLALYVADSRRPQFYYDLLKKISEQLLAGNSNSYDGLRIKGQLALTDGRTGEAIETLTRANSVNPLQPTVLIPLGEALFLEKRFAEGVAFASALIEKKPEVTEAYQLLYAHYMRQNQGKDAENTLLRMVQNNPTNADAILELAHHHQRQKQTPQMVAALDRILADARAFPQGLLLVGEFYSSIQDRQSAERLFEMGRKAHPEETIYLKKLVGLKIAQGKRDDALQLLEEILKKTPADSASRIVRAGLLLESGKVEDRKRAQSEFQALTRERTNDAGLRFKLGQSHLLFNERDQAKRELQEAARLQPDHLPALLTLAGLCTQMGNYQEALQHADRVLSLQPRNPGARFVRSVALMGTGALEEPRMELSKLQREFPESKDVQLQLGLLYVKEKRFSEAEKVFQKFYRAAAFDDTRPLEGLTQAYSVQAQYDKALRLLSEETAKSPDSKTVRQLLAGTALAAGKSDVAIEQYLALIQRGNASGTLYAQLGEAYERKNDLPSAMNSYGKARELSPKDGRIVAAIANLEALNGRSQQALTEYRRALELAPADPSILNNAAYLIAETAGNFDDALRYIERARKQRPDDPEVLDTLGWVYVKKKLTVSAVQVLGNLVAKHPENPGYRYHFAVALQQAGETAKAKAELTAALTQAPPKDLERKIRETLNTIG